MIPDYRLLTEKEKKYYGEINYKIFIPPEIDEKIKRIIAKNKWWAINNN